MASSRLDPALTMQPDQQIVVNGIVRKHAGALEGADQAEVGDLVRLQSVERRPAIADGAVGRIQKAGDDVEGRGLAGAVGPDQADDLALADRKIHVRERNEPPEMHGDLLDLQCRCGSRHHACSLASRSENATGATVLDPLPPLRKPLRQRRHDAARQYEQDDDQHAAIGDPLRLRRHDRTQEHRQQPEDHAADDRPGQRPLAAGDDHDHHRHGIDEGEHLGIDDPDIMRIETAGCTRDPGRDHRRQRERLCHVDADGYRQRFVFHQPAHGAAEMRMDQARDQEIGDNRD